MNRRRLLTSLGGAAAFGALGLRRPLLAGTDPVPCGPTGPTVGAVTGPFAPTEFRPILRGVENPGARTPVPENDMDLANVLGAAAAARGQVVRVQGRLVGADCAPLAGARVQLWQADEAGHYNHENERASVSPSELDPGFGYWGSALTDAEGRFTALTIVPGAYPAGRGWWRPPHLHWTLQAEGLPAVTTQSYFEGDGLIGAAQIRAYNDADLILHIREDFARGYDAASLAEARRRALEELVIRFAPGDDDILEGEITFRLG